jgi:hypothetical protein
VLLALVASGQAQTPPEPVVGFVSPYEIARTLHAAGFDVLAPPLREGTSYVVRATDFRGLLMRVVVDARTGAIRDATRIVPGPGRYGQLYGAPPPYDPADFDASVPVLGESERGPSTPPSMSAMPSASPMPPMSPLSAPPGMVPASPLARSSAAVHRVPLPRPRPAALASREGAAPAFVPQPSTPPVPAASAPGNINAGSGAGAAAAPEQAVKPQVSTDVITAAPPTSAVAPNASAAAASPKKPVAAPLND